MMPRSTSRSEPAGDDALPERIDGALDDNLEQFFLALEVVVHRSFGDAHGVGDLLHRDVGEAAREEAVGGLGDQELARGSACGGFAVDAVVHRLDAEFERDLPLLVPGAHAFLGLATSLFLPGLLLFFCLARGALPVVEFFHAIAKTA
jgi:hypothetical protein